ncbi:THUMP domain-containing protein [Leeia sp. TBRC 13508]|uniref:THUMP domain-containing protein n=1 Tax=Leeia speluncae TaxID=2884804 RepID=A0ABS8D5S0_9NEIS|nr:THUMP domain-containing protein [Leeia speluncae]MCB6183477.1 THUMP domain-containing protein [Leeia speluncae]
MSNERVHDFFATSPRGLETVLANELKSIGAENVQEVPGGVSFSGNWLLCAKVNRQSRIASRVLWKLRQAPYRTENDIYRAAVALPWGQWFNNDNTIKVSVSATKCPLRSLDFVTLKIKDAVCDHFRERTGARPSVDTVNPDHRVYAYLDPKTVTLYLDTSGEPLFKRGLRQVQGDAPLRENLAAGILVLSGWQADDGNGSCQPLLDPMCGSGTFLMEAAQMALGIDAGRGRPFSFEKIRSFPMEEWLAWRNERDAIKIETKALPIFGSDKFGDSLRLSKHNLDSAGLAGVVALKQCDVLEVSPPAENGVWVTNPPYGVRLGEQTALQAMYPKLGDVMKQRFAGWRCYYFTADLALAKGVRLSASKRTVLFNGALECRLFEYKVIAGSNRKPESDSPTESA